MSRFSPAGGGLNWTDRLCRRFVATVRKPRTRPRDGIFDWLPRFFNARVTPWGLNPSAAGGGETSSSSASAFELLLHLHPKLLHFPSFRFEYWDLTQSPLIIKRFPGDKFLSKFAIPQSTRSIFPPLCSCCEDFSRRICFYSFGPSECEGLRTISDDYWRHLAPFSHL